jgi:hypothetical protein
MQGEAMMLHGFLTAHREQLISRCRGRVGNIGLKGAGALLEGSLAKLRELIDHRSLPQARLVRGITAPPKP